MKIVVAGGTGFLGQPLCQVLVAAGHEVVALTRSLPDGARTGQRGSVQKVGWSPDGSMSAWTAEVSSADAVINLSGESIAARRWSQAQKARIRDSRLDATHSLMTAIRTATVPPSVLISGSAVGYYGLHTDERLTEASPPGNDFLAQVCVDWEQAATRSARMTRVVLIRTGIVLERDGGVLKKMVVPFKLFAGGPLGTGQQYMSWIHREDWIRLVRWAIEHEVSGPINATAPTPVTNGEFSVALGVVLNRPCWLPAPSFAIKAVLGEMGDALLLNGQRVLPARAQALGFSFRYGYLPGALRAILQPR